jgi:hypothetical protein
MAIFEVLIRYQLVPDLASESLIQVAFDRSCAETIPEDTKEVLEVIWIDEISGRWEWLRLLDFISFERFKLIVLTYRDFTCEQTLVYNGEATVAAMMVANNKIAASRTSRNCYRVIII